VVVPGPGRKIIVGEKRGGSSARVRSIVSLLGDAGFEAVESPCIQKDIWYKLWGNMTMNPITALTGATCDRVIDDPFLNRFSLEIMAEASRIGHRIGCSIAQTGEERNAVTRTLGAVKTSMQRDAEAGRAIELDAIVGAVREIGLLVGIPTPATDTLYGLTRMFAREHGLYT
jgi:2-dehydropantoate 2-reductase